MSGRRSRIGLTTYAQEASWGVWNTKAAVLHAAYLDAVVRAGGSPLLLPPSGTDTDVLDVLDGLIVVGGSDPDPALYGEKSHPLTASQPERDRHDLALTRGALDRGLPLFAICRGMQVLNILLGGTLHQHVPGVLPESNYQPSPGVFGSVEVEVRPGSLLHRAVGDRVVEPCYHHQAVDRLGEGLEVTGRSADGLVQAVETTAPGWVLGVQFHPEQNVEDLRLFRAHVEATTAAKGNAL